MGVIVLLLEYSFSVLYLVLVGGMACMLNQKKKYLYKCVYLWVSVFPAVVAPAVPRWPESTVC